MGVYRRYSVNQFIIKHSRSWLSSASGWSARTLLLYITLRHTLAIWGVPGTSSFPWKLVIGVAKMRMRTEESLKEVFTRKIGPT